jgi:hypothetical protein
MSPTCTSSLLQEEDDFDAEKRQKMREDLSTAIDDHMSGNNASGRSLIAPILRKTENLQRHRNRTCRQ